MKTNTQQAMQSRVYSLKDFGDFFDNEINKQYGTQVPANQQQIRAPRQNAQQQQMSQQGRQQMLLPKQNSRQIPQQNQIMQQKQ